jgi:4-amino-4-deoxy-L-arabinose transferase-like glycosyltransferase
MGIGYHLYEQIFYSQPPLFLMSIYPFYELLGSTITSARIGVAAVSFLGLLGAYLIGRALAGRAAGVVAVVLLMISPMYLEQSHTLHAEGPAIGLLFLTVAAAFMWWEHPTGRKGIAIAVLSAVTLALGILIKLPDAVAVVPIALLLVARVWSIRHETSSKIWVSLWPIAVAIVAAAITTLLILAPFAGCLNALVDQVVTFHLAARKMMNASHSDNVGTLSQFFSANRALVTAALVSVSVTVLRHEWRIVPLLVWFLATLILLVLQVPLWPRHAIFLIPPLITIVVLGLKGSPTTPTPIAWEQRGALLTGFVALVVVLFSLRHDYWHYRNLHTGDPSAATQVAADLERVTTRDDLIITDAQYAAALADRNTPPWLVDLSVTRLSSGYLTSRELMQAGANSRVHAVVLSPDNLTSPPFATFYPWVAENFRLLRTYGDGKELWVR